VTASQPPADAISVAALYARECARLGYERDPAQEEAVALLDELRGDLMQARKSGLTERLLGKLLSRGKHHELKRGLYLWGGVGRGKTWLMDLFFQSLPFRDKQRSHFHRFMQLVHEELRKHRERADPLELVADRISRRARVLCFDELFVTDIADAMLLGGLFKALFDRGVTLVATSNVAPDDLYKDGLQRARFLPAIALIKEHTRVVKVQGGADYRLRMLERAQMWFDSSDPASETALERLFETLAGEPGRSHSTLILNHRRVHVRRQAEEVIWFTFAELCAGARGQADYIELARCYHTVFLSDVPPLGPSSDDQARRFITLVDEFYDRGVKLVISSAQPVHELYEGTRLKFEFERTRSRLIEMQSQDYLARPHRA
jgi:cell division protein ZapE